MGRDADAPVARGVVAVRAQYSGQQGSGVLLTSQTVLTCAHVLGQDNHAWVAAPGTAGRRLFRLVWSDSRLDAALLQLPGDAPVPGSMARPAAVATDRPLPGCEVVGFPRVQRYDEGRKLESDQYTGTLLPLAGLIRRTMILELDRPPAAERADGLSPLAGLSGAPVHVGDSLLGIVKAVPRGRGHRRLECVPISAIVTADGFADAFEDATGWDAPTTTAHTPHTTGDSPYEQEYAEALGAAYRRTRIFGLDELGKRAAEWDLDTAYLSLEAVSRDREGVAVPRRIDDLLAARPRVLLRGDAGAGKTTLVWWLAAHAAAGTLGGELAELNGLVPFVVPLRTLRARGAGFPAPAELPAVAGLMVDTAPDGWVGRVLAAGRGLLLVDGLDEVPERDREDAHAWLCGLLCRYPRTRCVATVRPHAVEPDWLGAEDFQELALLPLRGPDIEAFVAAWHGAARLDADERDRAVLDDLERDLSQQFRHNPSLSELARTPLLCAVICALHRLHEGFLPETRWELYASALQMLLGTRDERRRIDAPDGIRMNVEEHQQLLQRLAAWLVRGGQTEFTREQALHRLDRTLPGMPRVQAQGTSEEILTHLINRSGLLQERTDDVFQFAHRTFQDFLAAKEFVEDDLLKELLRHAHDQQWHDVLLLAAGHCSRRELPVLVEGLLAAGSATRKRDTKTTLYVLAALCAQHAAWLSEPLHQRVRTAVRSVIPPRGSEQMGQLALLGGYVLPLLPGPGEVTKGAVEAVTGLITAIGGTQALPYARAFAENGEARRFSGDWDCFPAEGFARQVLPHLPAGEPVGVSTVQQLRLLRDVPHVSAVMLGGDYPAGTIARELGDRALSFLAILASSRMTTLDELRSLDCSRLTQLYIGGCPSLTLDLTPFHPLTDLEVKVSGVRRRNILGAAALGDRLTVEP
ncbi:NACHT domain-containing protein [Streptomyces sp. ISL-36]|uniref:serine protease n=1 Tax=Streptomyces sp. ISL-36 TaxID=2819182 RepID=UPI001BE5FD71|nr:serine protease [Streptomyces sp. ISL-36]MBT2443866.1 NACHT domain-containing protein [Streptomyces sp. ISL-36]